MKKSQDMFIHAILVQWTRKYNRTTQHKTNKSDQQGTYKSKAYK